MEQSRAFGLLLHTGRNLKAQGLPRSKRLALLEHIAMILRSYPITSTTVKVLGSFGATTVEPKF